MNMVPEGINEDAVIWIETTGGKMRIYPVGETWTIDAWDTKATGQPPVTVVAIDTIAKAMLIAMRAIFNPERAMQGQLTFKERVVAGLNGPMIDEYREQAERVLQARDML